MKTPVSLILRHFVGINLFEPTIHINLWRVLDLRWNHLLDTLCMIHTFTDLGTFPGIRPDQRPFYAGDTSLASKGFGVIRRDHQSRRCWAFADLVVTPSYSADFSLRLTVDTIIRSLAEFNGSSPIDIRHETYSNSQFA